MAFSHVETRVFNPADRGAGRKGAGKVAKRLSDKQIKYFGTARQRAALKARRKTNRSSGSTRKRFTKKKAATSHRPRTAPKKRQNIGPEMLIATLGNAATKGGGRKMATSKKKKFSSGAKHRNTSTKRSSGKRFSGKRRARNPGGLGSPMDWVQGGVGVLTGVVATRGVPQLVLGDKNVGGLGYFANAATAAAVGWVTHMVFPRNRVLVASVIAGGFAALIARVIGDFTTYGKFLTLTGVGDYMISNAPVPSRLVDPNSALVEVPGGWGSAMPMPIGNSVDNNGMGTGVDLGRRAGVC